MDLPVEIETHLLSYLHPYHLGIYSQVCKQSYEIACSLLRNKDILMCLLTHPIPESIKYYDRMNLFYHACETQQQDVLCYLNGKYDDNVFFILWKFGRVNEFKKLYLQGAITSKSAVQAFKSMCKLYPELKSIKDNMQLHFDRFSNSHIPPEFFTPYEKAKWEVNILDYTPSRGILNLLIHVHSKYLSKDELDDIFRTVGIELGDVKLSRRILPVDNLLMSIDQNVPEVYRGIHYLTAGYFEKYHEWISKGHKLIWDDKDWKGPNNYIRIIICLKLKTGIVVMSSLEHNSNKMTEAAKELTNGSDYKLVVLNTHCNKFGTITMSPYLPKVIIDDTEVDLRSHPEIFETADNLRQRKI